MKDPKPVPVNRPFEDLKRLLGKRRLPQAVATEKPCPPRLEFRSDSDDDGALFAEAMTGVVPLPPDKGRSQPAAPRQASDATPSLDGEAIRQLERLVGKGEGFVVSQTPEYMDGREPGVAPLVTHRLHRGDYSIQSFIDLHGLSAEEARIRFDTFMNSSTRSGKRAVLIIHGRGLSSPDRPVLKNRVREWLCSGRWSKWVMAFSSARMCDGGAGATCVLLRSRPLTKSERKKRAGKRSR